jgi:signal transduction histidine kinase/ActR/RegA family two-component response regulator
MGGREVDDAHAPMALPPLLTRIGPVIPRHAIWLRYGVALGVVLAVFLLRWALSPFLGVQAPLLPFLLGVLLCAYLAGRGPALLASAVTPVLATLWFTRWPEDAPPAQWLSHVAFFLVVAAIGTLMMDALQVAVRRATQNARRAEQAAAALREAGRRKDEFLAMLAHELRNPLTPVRNVAHILSRGPDAQTVRRAAEMLERQSNHLIHLVDDLLDVARITHRHIQLSREIVAVEDLIAIAVETVQPLVDARRQTIEVAVHARNIHVDGDPVRLGQVLTNLLTNASKYSPEGRGIQVALDSDGQDVRIRVRDEGIGIDPQQLPRVFDLFMQGDRSLDRAQGGLGIGLTIVRHLVDMHGGSVHATSAGLGMGSEFEVRLPRAVEPPVMAHGTRPSVPRRGRRRRVLVVDDDADCAQSLRDVLRLDGHEALSVRDGPAALSMLDDFAAEVVLLDVGLPRMDGYMVAHAIRTRFSPGRPRPRLVALTGYARDEDRQSALRSGFDEHLTKPVDPERLLALVARGGVKQPARELTR